MWFAYSPETLAESPKLTLIPSPRRFPLNTSFDSHQQSTCHIYLIAGPQVPDLSKSSRIADDSTPLILLRAMHPIDKRIRRFSGQTCRLSRSILIRTAFGYLCNHRVTTPIFKTRPGGVAPPGWSDVVRFFSFHWLMAACLVCVVLSLWLLARALRNLRRSPGCRQLVRCYFPSRL